MNIRKVIEESIEVKTRLLTNESLPEDISRAASACVRSLKNGGKILFCGNGGSAADAQHLAAELSGRFYYDRDPLHAEALHVNTSFLTAVANDYSFDEVFARMVRASGKEGDVLIALSTSGNSPNILRALEAAAAANIITVGLTGKGGGAMKNLCDHLITVPSDSTPRIQECHILIGHIICEIIESELFPIHG